MMQSSTGSGVDALVTVGATRAEARAQRARNDHRHSVRIRLAALDRRILHLRVKARTAPAEMNARLEPAVRLIAARRDEIATDLLALEAMPASAWSAAKTDVDRELWTLEALVGQV